MKKILYLIWFLFSIILVNSSYSQNQTNMYYRGEMNGWGATAMSSLSLPTSNVNWVVTINSDGNDIQSDFKFANTDNWSGIDWSRGDAIALDVLTDFYQPNGGNGNFNETNNKSYTFTIKDVVSGNSEGYVFEFSSAPVNISSVTDANTISAWPGQAISITATLSDTKPTEQKIWLRYSTSSNFSTSTILSMSNVSGNDYSADIPSSANSSGVTIYYYAFSTGDITANHTTADIATINFNKPTNSTYTIATTWTTSASGDGSWNDPNSWDAGVVPVSGQPVTIEDDFVLDQSANVSNLTISNGVTFTSSDATARTLTISDGGALTNNGTFTAGTGKVSFAGSGTVSGTVFFNDVDISGGVNFGDNSTVTGVLQINAGGYVDTKAPIYETGSILRYNTGTNYGISSEWYADQTSGAGVPYNVDISSSTQVHFSGSQAHTMNGNLTIATGKIFTLSETIGADLFIKGDFINNGGTFNSNSRLVTFNGTTSQEIKGSGSTSFGYVTIANTAGVSINGSELITVANDLTVNASTSLSIEPGRSLTVTGTLTNNAGATGLVIKSDASGTGSLKTDGVVSGSITAQRYFGGNNWDWHLLSSPVSNQNIQNEFVPESFTTDEDFYCYYEPTSEWVNYKNSTTPPTWTTANGDNTFVEGKGYMVSYNSNDFTKSFTGTPNTGSQSFTLSKAQTTGNYIGVNLAGNPYPSSIDWKAATGWTRTGLVDNSGFDMYIWNQSASNYGVYNSSSGDDNGTNSVTRYIPPMQGFFVNAASDEGAFSMTNDVRVHNNASNWLKNGEENNSQFRVVVNSVENYGTDEVVIETGHETSAGGALKMFSFVESAPSLYLPKENKNYSISFLQDVPAGTTIPLYFGAGIDGQYELAFTFDYQLYTNVKLSDNETGIITDITENSVYQFFSAKDDDPNRFLLHFGVVGIGEQDQAPTLQAYMVDNRLYVNNSLEQAQLAVYDLQGRLVAEQSLNTAGLQALPLELPAGVYIVRLNNASESRAVKINVQ